MDLQEQRQLEVARQMAKVKARARQWRAIFALVLAAAAGIISSTAGRDFTSWTEHDHAASKIVAASTAAAFCLLAAVGILGLAGRTRQALQPLTGTAHAAVIRYTIVLAGFILTLVLTLGLLRVPISQLIVGGVLTTILIGIAAQQSLSNVFAGLVLLLSRPVYRRRRHPTPVGRHGRPARRHGHRDRHHLPAPGYRGRPDVPAQRPGPRCRRQPRRPAVWRHRPTGSQRPASSTGRPGRRSRTRRRPRRPASGPRRRRTASASQPAPAERHQMAPGQQPPGGSSPQA